jgi:hypothetical protein
VVVDPVSAREYGRRDRKATPEGDTMASAQEIGAKFVEAFNAHDEARIRELNAENTKFEAPGDVKIEGGEAATQYAMAWIRGFPDARITVHNELSSGDWVAQEITFEGTTRTRSRGRAATSPPRTSGSSAAPSRSSTSRATQSPTRASITTRCRS